MSMNISLPSQLEKLVRQKVESGHYASASEVVREALRLFEKIESQRSEKLEALKSQIQKGMNSGEANPLDMQSIKAASRKNLS